MGDFSFLINSVQNITGPMVVMWLIGGLLIWLAIKKDYEPALLLPMGFGAILVNLPDTGVLGDNGIIQWLYNVGIGASEAFPLLLFVGIGAMIDFGPLLSNPKMLLFGGAAQFGIFMTVVLAVLLGFPLRDAMSAGVIGAADGPTAIMVSQVLNSDYKGAITVAAYSYMALVPIIQPMAIKLVTTKKERQIRMPYNPKSVSRTTKILFPIIVTLIAGLIAPDSIALVGFLMFGNLIRECGRLENLSLTAQGPLANLITIFLGITNEGGSVLNLGHLAGHGSRPVRLCIRYHGRRAVCQAFKHFSAQGQEDQPHGRRRRHFRVPHERQGDPEDGLERGQPESPADARGWRQCGRTDRFRGSGRHYSFSGPHLWPAVRRLGL